MPVLSVSLLSADLVHLATELQKIHAAPVSSIHYDIMDGHFVENIALGFPLLAQLAQHTTLPIVCHLMVATPQKWIRQTAQAGASVFVFHPEATDTRQHTLQTIQEIHQAGMKAGLAINPETPASTLFPYLTALDCVLVMTVEPGFGGQPLQEHCLHKIQEIKARNTGLSVGIDGGVAINTLHAIHPHSPDFLVLGSVFWNTQHRAAILQQLDSHGLTNNSAK